MNNNISQRAKASKWTNTIGRQSWKAVEDRYVWTDTGIGSASDRDGYLHVYPFYHALHEAEPAGSAGHALLPEV
jgi:hypothetical protein